MFDAQDLLGGLLKDAISGGHSGANLGNKSVLGMGALGVAMAAFEHFTEAQSSSLQTAESNKQPPALESAQPPKQRVAPPPVPPTVTTIKNTPMPPPPMPAQKAIQNTALRLIDAMLAAANADGYIDSEEKAKILQQLKLIDSDQEGFDYVQQRIDNPPTLEQVCQSPLDPAIAKQIYMVSLLAITVDTIEESHYLNKLASCLPIDAQVIAQLNEQFKTKE